MDKLSFLNKQAEAATKKHLNNRNMLIFEAAIACLSDTMTRDEVIQFLENYTRYYKDLI